MVFRHRIENAEDWKSTPPSTVLNSSGGTSGTGTSGSAAPGTSLTAVSGIPTAIQTSNGLAQNTAAGGGNGGQTEGLSRAASHNRRAISQPGVLGEWQRRTMRRASHSLDVCRSWHLHPMDINGQRSVVVDPVCRFGASLLRSSGVHQISVTHPPRGRRANPILQMQVGKGGLNAAAFSPEGPSHPTYLALACRDGYLRVLDFEKEQLVLALRYRARLHSRLRAARSPRNPLNTLRICLFWWLVWGSDPIMVRCSAFRGATTGSTLRRVERTIL